MNVGIAGVGGIGSNVARLLAQACVQPKLASPHHLTALSLILVDQDQVEAGNLNRQFYTQSQAGASKAQSLKTNLEAISPSLKIQALDRTIGPKDALELFGHCHLVIEGFDDPAMKKMLMEELSPTGIPLVSASGIAGDKLDRVRVKRLGNCHIVGDFTSDQDRAPLFPPKVALVTAHMAAIALDILTTQRQKHGGRAPQRRQP